MSLREKLGRTQACKRCIQAALLYRSKEVKYGPKLGHMDSCIRVQRRNFKYLI